MAEQNGGEDMGQREIERWWHTIRPYWHVISFLVIITFLVSGKWSIIENYGQALAAHDARISALELQSRTTAVDIAVIKQQVNDIHNITFPDDERPSKR